MKVITGYIVFANWMKRKLFVRIGKNFKLDLFYNFLHIFLCFRKQRLTYLENT